MANNTINAIVATDCGSTTTKAILIKLVDGEYRLIVRGEAPTNDCETGGGVCVPSSGDSDGCPTGWGLVYTSCGGEGACCMPGEFCV